MKRYLVPASLALLLAATACRTQKQPVPHLPPTPTRPLPVQESTPQVPAPAAVVVAPPPVVVTPRITPPPPSESKLKMPAIFSDNMVLQQGMAVPIWGWANEGERVTVSFDGQRVSTMPRDGKWMVHLKHLKPGQPQTLTMSGVSTIQLTNVVVGEVWVCSGQSNMEWPMFKTFEPEAAITNSSNSFIRLFHVPHKKSDTPLSDISADILPRWQEAQPETVRSFSAVGYYFGRELNERLGVPVGLIQSTWGGSPAEVWMRQEVLERKLRYQTEILDRYPAEREAYEKAFAEHQRVEEANKRNGIQKRLVAPRAPWKPAELYNGMIAPIVPFGIKGVIWYQGESNARRGSSEMYEELFSDLIWNWRNDWDQGAFPFLFVQLAPFRAIQSNPTESDWAEVRAAQLNTLKNVPRTGMAVITDLGDEKDIHPTKKAPVAERLALWARAVSYGEKLVHSGPIFRKVEREGDRMIISFDHAGSGLVAQGGAIRGFSIAGPDRKFIWARAEIISEDSVMVWSPNISDPVAVRFGWADYPVVNLWNQEGLPASPFRTDDFPSGSQQN